MAALTSVVAAMLARQFGPVVVAAVVALAALSPVGLSPPSLRPALLCAIPAALVGLQPPGAEADWPRRGPVRIDGVVPAPLRRDLPAGSARFRLQPRGTAETLACSVTLPRQIAPDALLPGDRLRGAGFLEPARHGDRPPRLRCDLAAMRVESGGWLPMRIATAIRLRFEDELLARLDGRAGLVCCHLVLGSGPALPEALVEAHRATGLAHLLAVSGAHASMLAFLLGLAYRMLRGRDPWSSRGYRRVAAVILLLYGAITGWEPPVFRALVAFLVAAWATSRGRRASLVSALALPALLTAWLWPDDLFSLSFWLSYAAVIGLSAAGAFGRGGPWHDVLRLWLRASAWTMLCTAPLTLWYFGQLAPWTVIGTPLCAPMVGLMLALGLLTSVLAVLAPPLAVLTAWPLQLLADAYAGIVLLLAELPMTPIHATWQPPPLVLLAFALIATAALCHSTSRRRLAWSCALLCLPFFVPLAAADEDRLSLCDVGHGQACVLALGADGTAVIDCGSQGSPFRAARAVIDALPARRRIDLLVLSHDDADHVGGVDQLATRTAIGRAILPAVMRSSNTARVLRRRGVPCQWLEAGEEFEALPGLRVHAPRIAGGEHSDNDHSLWVRVERGGLSAILPGDAETTGIARAIRDGVAAPADLLILPHHGRGPERANRRLLERVGPRLVLCSNGDRDEPPLQRLARDSGLTVLSTAERGRIDIELRTGGSLSTEYELQLR